MYDIAKSIKLSRQRNQKKLNSEVIAPDISGSQPRVIISDIETSRETSESADATQGGIKNNITNTNRDGKVLGPGPKDLVLGPGPQIFRS